MDFKEVTILILDQLKKLGWDRRRIEKELAYSEKYIDQALSKGSNEKLYVSLRNLQKTILQSSPLDNQVLSSAAERSIRKPKTTSSPVTIPFLPIKAQGGYVKSYDQMQYMETLDRFALPPGVDHRGAEWMYFEVDGDSMEGTFTPGDILLASLVPQMDWDQLRNFYVYVIVTESDLWIKRLYRKNEKQWVMISDNEDSYPQQLINVEDVKQLWVYRRTWHTNAKPPKQFEIKI